MVAGLIEQLCCQMIFGVSHNHVLPTGSYFFARPPEGKTSGALDELTRGHKYAFDRVVSVLSGSTGLGDILR